MDKNLRETYALGANRYITSNELASHIMRDRIYGEIEILLKEIELHCSRFIKDSLLNQRGETAIIKPDWLILKEVIEKAERLKKQTQGYFDITVGSTLSDVGYGNPTTGNHPQYDLGGFVKGRAIDQLSRVLNSYDITNYIINAGGDMLSRGDSIKAFIQHPLDTNIFLGEVEIRNNSLCTSSIRPRRRRPSINDDDTKERGTFFHHITSDGISAVGPIIGASTMHTDAMIADAAATTFLVCPVQEVEKIAKTLEVEFLIIFDDMSTIQSSRFPLFIDK